MDTQLSGIVTLIRSALKDEVLAFPENFNLESAVQSPEAVGRLCVPYCQREAADQPALNEPAKERVLRKLLFRDYARKNENGSCDIPLILKKYGG